MKGTYSTIGLVWSRMRFDRKRHFVAASAVTILMASFLTFNAVAAGLDEGIRATIAEEGHDQLQLSQGGIGFGGQQAGSIDVSAIESWDGVEAVSARSAEATGVEVEGNMGPAGQGGQGGQGGPGGQNGPRGNFTFNRTQEIVLVRIDAATEAALVETADPTAQQAGFGRGFAADSYQLVSGRWIETGNDAIITQGLLDEGLVLGGAFSHAGQTWNIVGVIQDRHPAAIQPSGSIAGGHVLVDGTGGQVMGAFILMEPDFYSIQAVTQRVIDEYPQAAFGLEPRLAQLEAQHFDAARTQTVLSAAARLVGAAGVATVFAMSLFLLIGERKAFGTMSSIGFARPRLSSYMNQKMVYVAILGAVAGGALGWLVIQVIPAPEVSFAFEPVIDAAGWLLASVQTLGAAILGSLIAFALTIRQDPIEALRATE